MWVFSTGRPSEVTELNSGYSVIRAMHYVSTLQKSLDIGVALTSPYDHLVKVEKYKSAHYRLFRL